MKNTLLFALLFSSLSAYAAPRPGLWEIQTEVKSQDPRAAEAQAKMKEAMKDLSPAQRVQMQKMMGKTGLAIGNDGVMKFCFTEESVKSLENQTKDSVDSKCDTKITERNSKRLRTTFTCEDGTTGTGSWDFASDSRYTSTIVAKSPKGETSEIVHRAKFLGKDCGDVKPFGK